MRSSLLKRGMRVALVGGAAAAMLLTVVNPAGAAPPPGNLLDKDGSGTVTAGDEIITVAGSDTLEFVTESIYDSFASSIKTHVFPVKPGPALIGDYTVPADAFCGSLTYNAGEGTGQLLNDTDADGKLYPPFGSSDGRNALKQTADPALTYGSVAIDTGNACVDVARSSSNPSGSDPAEFEYYGFALDSLSWGTTSLNAPVSLRLQQVRDIYNCVDETTAGLTPTQQALDADTKLNNWAEVGGAPGRISRALAQNGSGTRAFSISAVLGGVTPPNGLSAVGCPDVLEVRENDGRPFVESANEPRYNEYIIIYSTGKWVFQVTNKINPTKDIRSGVRLGAIERDGVAQACPTKGALTFADENNAPAFAVRYDGSAYLLNASTIICSNTATGVTADAAFDTSLTAAPGTFTQDMVGLVASGSFLNEGTVVQAVSVDGSTLTIAPGAKFGPTYPATGSVTIGIPVVSEFNPNITTTSNVQIFPGVRMLYHVLDTRQGAASYSEARQLFGFETGTSNKSELCDGQLTGAILSNGFLDLPAITNNGTPLTTCRYL